MNSAHKFLFGIKFVFMIILLIIFIDPNDFSKQSPIYIIIHTIFTISICLYIIYKLLPFTNNKDLDRFDNIYIIIICLMLMRKIELINFLQSFPILFNNINNLTFNKVEN